MTTDNLPLWNIHVEIVYTFGLVIHYKPSQTLLFLPMLWQRHVKFTKQQKRRKCMLILYSLWRLKRLYPALLLYRNAKPLNTKSIHKIRYSHDTPILDFSITLTITYTNNKSTVKKRVTLMWINKIPLHTKLSLLSLPRYLS